MTPEFDVDGSHRRASSDRKNLLGRGFDSRVVGRRHFIRLSRAFNQSARRWVELSSEDSGDKERQSRRLYRNFLSMA